MCLKFEVIYCKGRSSSMGMRASQIYKKFLFCYLFICVGEVAFIGAPYLLSLSET